MIKYLSEHPWKIIEEGFNPDRQKSSESLFSLGNGHMGHRANFEEEFSGPSLQGNYLAGIYYPDKTRVGWWKNGYPEYFAKVLNAPSWIGINIKINNQTLDLNRLSINSFTRTLDMQKGLLIRAFQVEFGGGEIVNVSVERFVSLDRKETGAIKYSLQLLKGQGKCKADICVDGDVRNQDSNYDEKFWEPVSSHFSGPIGVISSKTKKTDFTVATGMCTEVHLNGEAQNVTPVEKTTNERVSHIYELDLAESDTVAFVKLASILTSRDHPAEDLSRLATESCMKNRSIGYDNLRKEQIESWARKWETSDIVIEGDVSAQQGIRFSIFQLNQTYSGHDPRLNIGPKGFTGEKYGGSTYWDTEAYCLPFYLSTSSQEVARNLLIYRYKHLGKAIENASKLGFNKGAALFPMVTMNGEECHNEWEITFEEIHRNGAIAYAIYNYIRHTGDEEYMYEYGLEVLVALARFWVQRVNYSTPKGKYVILGVTGPNEYENNVNNNWYTNYIAAWTLKYTFDSLKKLELQNPNIFNELTHRLDLDTEAETATWLEVSEQIFLPENKELGIFVQQEGYMDKEQMMADDLPESVRPINQNWSWDRILRSCFIKQADVIQGLYFFEDHFEMETHRRNFEFYESRTVHESSLSPSLHVILASKLGLKEKAYDLYHRTARLDLDDYNLEVHEGCHITSMAGSWLAVVEGFGGMRIKDGQLHFNPSLPDSWNKLQFTIGFRGRVIKVTIEQDGTSLELVDGEGVMVWVSGEKFELN